MIWFYQSQSGTIGDSPYSSMISIKQTSHDPFLLKTDHFRTSGKSETVSHKSGHMINWVSNGFRFINNHSGKFICIHMSFKVIHDFILGNKIKN